MAFPENLSRRKFLSGSALALTPLAMNRLGEAAVNLTAAAQPKQSIIKRKLGRTGLQIPIVSMGVMNADNPAVVKESYETGVRFFDTAMGYQAGRNEEMVGSVIKSLGVRDKVYIQTKIFMPRTAPNATAEQLSAEILKSLDGCLKRLQSDYVDILLLHGATVPIMNNPGVMQALGDAKKQKRARFIGFSTHEATQTLNEVAKSSFYDAVTIMFNFTNASDTALLDAIKKAHASGVGIIAMKTQAGRRGPTPGPFVNQTAALKWVLNHPEIATAIPGYTNFEHMKEDFSVAYGLTYTKEEKDFLATKNLVAQMQFCQQCSECVPTCAKRLDIPTLMRTHMYAARYENFVHARTTFEEIEEGRRLNDCSNCAECTARCSRHVDVARNMRDLKAMYL